MRYQDQQLREILDAVRHPVNPTHEAAFKAILLDDKRRSRRTLLWLCICAIGLLAGGYGLMTSTSLFPAAERAIEKFTNPESSAFRSASPSTENSASNNALSSADQAQSSAAESQNSGLLNTSTETSGAMSATPGASATDNSSLSKKDHFTTLSTQNTGKQHPSSSANTESGKSKASHSQTKSQNPAMIGGTSDGPTSDAMSAKIEDNQKISPLSNPELNPSKGPDQTLDESRSSHETNLLKRNASGLETENEIADANEILPSAQRVHKHRIHYGLSLAMYPAGSLFKKSIINTGVGYQVGGFASYRLNARTQVRAEAGFAKLDGGFSYVKQSSSQQFGFSVLNQNHTLEVEKLYSGYAAAEIGLIDGKQIFSLGVITQYLYGARGYIETREHGQVETPIITTVEDVWLSTTDIPKVSLHGTLGVRSKLSRRLEIGALIRVPIIHTLREPSNADAYQYTVKSHGVSPQVSLSYQLNQQ